MANGDDFISESSDVLSIHTDSYIRNTESESSFVLSMQRLQILNFKFQIYYGSKGCKSCEFKISSFKYNKVARVAKVANSQVQTLSFFKRYIIFKDK